jgi:protein-disulfide isomerase|tara:strand:+ start:446 stop:1072 length:627 start_codon:yes stop_codon:yes gene_type:complete
MKNLYKILVFNFFVVIFSSSQLSAEITLKPLYEKTGRDLAERMIEVMPSLNALSIGNENAKNIIVEFLDYNCGYCKKIHPELMEVVKNEDVKLYFYQFPILSESSKLYSRTVLAVMVQDHDKGLKAHDLMMSHKGSLNAEKVQTILEDLNIDFDQFAKDMESVDLDEMLAISYYLAKSIQSRGTPAMVINDEIIFGYVPKSRIKGLLR